MDNDNAVGRYEPLVSDYKSAVILFSAGPTDERATEMRRRRAALDKYVEGMEDDNELLREALAVLLSDYLEHMHENVYTERARAALFGAE
jgi:hypothetical protein